MNRSVAIPIFSASLRASSVLVAAPVPAANAPAGYITDFVHRPLATQNVALGTRQVGKVICIIPNPKGDLIPGTNVNAVIRSETVKDATAIPKEALFREGGQTGVYVLNGNKLAWRPVTLGVGNVTRTQVHELQEDESVAIPGGRALTDGMLVRGQ